MCNRERTSVLPVVACFVSMGLFEKFKLYTNYNLIKNTIEACIFCVRKRKDSNYHICDSCVKRRQKFPLYLSVSYG